MLGVGTESSLSGAGKILRNEGICHHSAHANKNIRPHQPRGYELACRDVIKIENYKCRRFQNWPNLQPENYKCLLHGCGITKKRQPFEICNSCKCEILTFWVHVAIIESPISARWMEMQRLHLHLSVSVRTEWQSHCISPNLHFVFSSLAAHPEKVPKWILLWGISLAPYLGKQKE